MNETDTVFHTDDCGSTRRYNFRRIKTPTIRFKVKAERDAAIALSPDDEEEPHDMYEVSWRKKICYKLDKMKKDSRKACLNLRIVVEENYKDRKICLTSKQYIQIIKFNKMFFLIF